MYCFTSIQRLESEVKKTLTREQKRSAAEAVRLQKVLAKVESSLASSAAQLKREEGKFSRLLARVQPTGGARTRRSA
jgi:hypothetical protein